MNERIKQLAEQAQKVVGYTDGGYTEIKALDQEKFAELIVRECIEQLEIGKRCDPYTGELFSCDRNDDIDYEIAVLKEHFGVEQ